MTTKQQETLDTKQFQNDIQRVVTAGDNIKETVRNMTINALTKGDLDLHAIREVADAVLKGSKLGAVSHGANIKTILELAISGLDEALSAAAEASKLTIEEALDQGKSFSDHDLKQTLNDMRSLEDLFVETLRDAAKSSKDQFAVILNDIANHAQNSGTVVGEKVKGTITELVKQLEKVAKLQLKSGAESVKTTGSILARLAAGMLEGLADSLHPSADSQAQSKRDSQDKTS